MDKHLAAPRCAGADRATAVHEDAIEPGAKALGIAALERAVCAHERILQRFFSVLMIADHVNSIAPQAIAVAGSQHAVGADIAGPDSAHQLSVAWFHCMYTHSPSTGVTSDVRASSLGISVQAGHP